MEDDGQLTRTFEVLITGWKTKPKAAPQELHAADTAYEGTSVTFVKNSSEGINRMKSRRIWAGDTPGGWLTHARPEGPRAKQPMESAEDIGGIQPIVSSNG